MGMCKRINHEMSEELTRVKNNIALLGYTHIWDRVKKLSNDYELVCISVTSRIPVSRSYFKMIEIFKVLTHLKHPFSSHTPIKTAHLCEAPGGFIEAIDDLCSQEAIRVQGCTAITLTTSNQKVPVWNLGGLRVLSPNIISGEDGTGDIYKLANVKQFIKHARGSALITADGGFDFSQNYNQQETMFQHLLLCEVYCAIQSQTQGGAFVVKVFDTFSTHTIRMLYILSLFYEEISLYKPLTSRPANSERYVLCCKFKGIDAATKSDLQGGLALKLMRFAIADFAKHGSMLASINIPPPFLDTVTRANIEMSASQIMHIYKTFVFADTVGFSTDSEFSSYFKSVQTRKRDEWYRFFSVNKAAAASPISS